MDFRQRLEQNKTQCAGSNTATEPADNFGYRYFSTDRGNPVTCLDLRLRDGNRRAVPYSYFTEINFDADMGIEILTTRHRIGITGRNLMQLYDYLVTYRVRYVQANIGNDTGEDELFVKEIVIDEL